MQINFMYNNKKKIYSFINFFGRFFLYNYNIYKIWVAV